MENDKSLREIELEKVKEVIKDNFNDADCGCYSTRNLVGVSMTTLYSGTYFTVDISYFWSYFEIFGATPEEFKELHDYYESLYIEEDEEDEVRVPIPDETFNNMSNKENMNEKQGHDRMKNTYINFIKYFGEDLIGKADAIASNLENVSSITINCEISLNSVLHYSVTKNYNVSKKGENENV